MKKGERDHHRERLHQEINNLLELDYIRYMIVVIYLIYVIYVIYVIYAIVEVT